MRAMSEQWAIQIDVTNRCPHGCSNCTRLTRHVQETPYFMPVEQFREILRCAAPFPTESPPDPEGRTKVIGIIGGEPTLHPQFTELVDAIEELVPDRKHRGLWTSLGPIYREHQARCGEVFGFQNKNAHDKPCWHQPVAVAARELMDDTRAMWKLIWDCWLQTHWCGSITPRGVYFCEVAATWDLLLRPEAESLALPVTDHFWNRSMIDFHPQMKAYCPLCGLAMPLPRRRDTDRRDDITPGNLKLLTDALGHEPQDVVLFDPTGYRPETYADNWHPRRYREPSPDDVGNPQP